MSAAPKLPPVVHIPERARRGAGRADRPRRAPNGVTGGPGVVVAFPAGRAGCVVPPGDPAAIRPASARPVASPVAQAPASATPVLAAPVLTAPGVVGERLPAAVRLTRRGQAVLALAAVVATAALLWVAHLSAPAGNADGAMPAAVTVHDGDTLWGIAARLAPGHDPRGVVAQLQRVNRLAGGALVPGQVLRTR